MKIFIAGASGAIGRPLVRQLGEAGHDLVGMTRSNAGALEAMGATAVVADAFDRDGVLAAVQEAQPDVVVNELTDLAAPLNPRKYEQWLAGTNRLRREATRNLADAATAAGASKFVSQSVAFMPPDPAVAGEAGAAIAALERVTLAAPGGIVLRYGFFYGPGTGYARDGQQAQMVRKRQMPIIGSGETPFPFIHVDDAAAATVAAIERGAPGVYEIVDDEPARQRDWVPLVAQTLGAKKPLRVPAWLARLVGGRMVAMATQLQPVSNAKAKQELDWQPRYASWREGFPVEFG